MSLHWWRRLRLRAKIFLPFSLLILAALLATLWLINSAVSRQVEDSLKRQLVVTGDVFRGLVTERAERLMANTSLLSADFALKRALATYDPETLVSVAVNYRRRAGVEALWITDESGALLATSRGPGERATQLRDVPPLAGAMTAQEPAVAITELENELFELVAVPVFAPDPIGYLLAGEPINDATAAQLRAETGSEVSFLTADRVFASSWPPAARAAVFPTGRLSGNFLTRAPNTTFLVPVADERFLSILVPIDARLSQPLYALVQQSYDDALAPLRALQRRVAVIGIVGLLAALLVGAALAGGIAAPLQTLVTGMRRVLAGDFRQRLDLARDDEIGFLARSFNDMVAGLEEREMIKDTFGRFVSRDIASAVLSGQLPLAGERREVTILFQDIRGFTSIAERTDPAVLVRMINRFFTAMVAAVEAEGGVIKQFTGDGVMALFGAPVWHADDPARATRAALEMVGRLPGLNATLSEDGLQPLRIGIGIHTGEVVAGKIGPDERVEYTVIGDAVNVASRIEGLTKELGATILVSAVTAAQLPSSFHFGRRAVLPVRGKEHPIEVVEILGQDARAGEKNSPIP
jgi:adenylate cyclase